MVDPAPCARAWRLGLHFYWMPSRLVFYVRTCDERGQVGVHVARWWVRVWKVRAAMWGLLRCTMPRLQLRSWPSVVFARAHSRRQDNSIVYLCLLAMKGGTKPPIVNVPAVGLCIQARLGHAPTGYRLSLARPSLGKPLKPLVLSAITEHIVYAQSRIQ